MKILRIHSLLLRNEEWFQFYTEFKALVEKYSPDTLNITALFATFLVLYVDADVALEIIRKSPDTAKMIVADQKRDHTFRSLTDLVRAFLNHFDSAKREAAQQLTILFDHYGNLARKAPNEETAGIHNLLQELNGPYAAQVELLGIHEWTTQLSLDNEEYEALVRDRNAEVATRSQLRMKEIRRQVQDVYALIVDHIQSSIVIYGEQAYAAFVNELNAFIKRYNDVLAQRQGRNKKDEL
ncbi:MAG: DUF6261 family protein [Tannerella sp.]|jgi:hypothetical protein|nr:DUF6261 family protein [Tannerella sp.]